LEKDSSKEVEKQINPDRYLGKIKPLKEIDKTLNPIEFCRKYSPIKPKPMQELILKAFYNLPLNDEEKTKLLSMRSRGKTTWEEGRRYQELILLIGMKGGKTTLAALIAQIEEYELFKTGDICKHYGFAPGERIYIKNVATNEKQAEKTIFAKIQASIDRSPYFKTRMPNLVGNTYHFRDTNVFIESANSNSSSLTGDICKLVSLDELDRFTNTKNGKYSAEEVYSALDKSTDPFEKDGRKVSISSLVHLKGFKYSGKTFFFKIPIPIEHRDSFKKNPGKFLRDKACLGGYSQGKYYRMPDKVKAIFERSHNEGFKNPIDSNGRFADWFKAKEGCKYYEHHDPSVSHDAYSISLGHEEDGVSFIDLMIRFLPPVQGGEIDIEEVKEFCDNMHERIRPEKITYDTWAASAIMQGFQKKGYETENLYIRKAQHDLLKEKIYSSKFRCPNYPIIPTELIELDLDGDKVDHPLNGSKDSADSVAGVVWNCSRNAGISAGVAVGGADSQGEVSKAGFKELEYAGRKRIWD